MSRLTISVFLTYFTLLFACKNTSNNQSSKESGNVGPSFVKGSFGYDLDFLKKHHKDLVLLSDDSSKAQVILLPAYQGRVMTSSARGSGGSSYGWLNHDLIASGVYSPHIMAYGGEERFWIGPEGGQFSVFFKKGSKFDLASWQTPAVIDTVSYNLIEKQTNKAIFSKDFEVENHSGTKFSVSIKREILLLNQTQAEEHLNVSLKDVQWVGYQTVNDLKNIGHADWDKSKGVLSIWLLGMMKASPSNTVIIPFKKGHSDKINDAYFGKIASDRLIKKDSVLFFKADASSRGKIGIPPQALIPIAGGYNAQDKVLTILQFDYNGATDYVNSMWEIQKFPYKGDVLNAYNDGKNETGTQLGQFFELESSSPAVALKCNEVLRHVQRTYHFEGSDSQLDILCKQILGVGLKDIKF